ncbi:MAG: CDP-2,3-bis-(O-geranylgeranyl)-sn-glycerol synthase [Euryarchaeota archaeon]|nr:CDP-2,3-bis-(O-geranylgeranyl)-sn-glycerol synthase [Euryarchaeota archaeon]MDP3103856.1 CDP-2,3-bis-(O-geranylgeranyl)-sn-glycerol synthase [Candidatus Methanoperedens sp.]
MFEIIIYFFGTVILAMWLMLPAYIANPMAVVFGGGKPIDMGRKWYDGQRVFGDGKTIRGLIGGTACGIVSGIIQIYAVSYAASEFNISIVAPTLTAVITLSFGALLGDLIKSFFKRRIGFVRGAELPLIDQLDFVAGAWLLTYIFDPVWFTEYFISSPWIIVTVLILTPILHRLTNIFGYNIKLKKEPW